MLMRTDNSALLDDLLIRWHEHCKRFSMAKGYSARAAGCDSWQASKQYDTETTTHSDNLDHAQVREFDEFMDKLHSDRPQYYLAIALNAKNLSVGAFVYSNPRLPKGGELKALTVAARQFAIDKFLGAC